MSLLDCKTGCRSPVVVQSDGASRHISLLAVDIGHRTIHTFEKTGNMFQSNSIQLQGAIKGFRDCLCRQIIFRGTQASRADTKRGSRCSVADQITNVSEPVSDCSMAPGQ